MLTPKQNAFVTAYLIDNNGTKAAIEAGYSEATARSAASRLLTHPGVIAALDQRAQKATKEEIKSVAFVSNLLAVIGAEKKPLDYMLSVMNDESADDERRDKMAMAAAPYLHAKRGDSGKKEDVLDAAKKASSGKFSASAAPKLVVNNRR